VSAGRSASRSIGRAEGRSRSAFMTTSSPRSAMRSSLARHWPRMFEHASLYDAAIGADSSNGLSWRVDGGRRLLSCFNRLPCGRGRRHLFDDATAPSDLLCGTSRRSWSNQWPGWGSRIFHRARTYHRARRYHGQRRFGSREIATRTRKQRHGAGHTCYDTECGCCESHTHVLPKLAGGTRIAEVWMEFVSGRI